ncbi:MAG: hypothetical protein GXP28_05015 [Planctomycetes bacterium]|nr:hypothetical protein [Planctomycetota bacterium]
MLPDPLRLAIAFVPLASYCFLLGLINARRRPFLTTGGADLAALGAALSGFVLVGPIELFRPEAASAEYGSYVWAFLLVFYWLSIWLTVLLVRPRLVVYNISEEELRPILAEAARAIDPQARWAGESLSLPTLGVQLHLESDASCVVDRERHQAESCRLATANPPALRATAAAEGCVQSSSARTRTPGTPIAGQQHRPHAGPSPTIGSGNARDSHVLNVH